jgi:hypothetical protein
MDPLIAQYDLQGKPTIALPDDSAIVKASEAFFEDVLADVSPAMEKVKKAGKL